VSAQLSTPVDASVATRTLPAKTFWGRALRHRSFVLGGVLSLLVVLSALLSLVWTPWSPYEIDIASKLRPPSAAHWLGTDDRGRDVAARLVHGARVALVVGPLAVAVYVVLGLIVGVLAALGGRVDFVVGRVVEIGLMFPTLLLLLAIQGVTSSTSLAEVALAIAVTQWPYVARLTRAEALRVAALPHVEAARAVGASRARVLFRHVLPLSLTPALTTAAFGIGQAVLFESALTFLGFGVPPPTASWGELLAQAQAGGLQAWLLWPAAVAIAVVVLACNLVGDGVRAALSAEPGSA
jgi:peptide/nickel transport system permease protein